MSIESPRQFCSARGVRTRQTQRVRCWDQGAWWFTAAPDASSSQGQRRRERTTLSPKIFLQQFCAPSGRLVRFAFSLLPCPFSLLPCPLFLFSCPLSKPAVIGNALCSGHIHSAPTPRTPTPAPQHPFDRMQGFSASLMLSMVSARLRRSFPTSGAFSCAALQRISLDVCVRSSASASQRSAGPARRGPVSK
jgi:hypothetical protein